MYTHVMLRQQPQWKEQAVKWFHTKWGVPQEAYLACMEDYLPQETEMAGISAWMGKSPSRMYIHR